MSEMKDRRQSFQTIAWFNDLYTRTILNLDPPYQRRSVWNEQYRQYFVETILLDYPAPALFIHEEISPNGAAFYSVVDGKQRLTTVLDFVRDKFPVASNTQLPEFAGYFFSSLPDETKRQFWSYQFSVEYLPTVENATLNNVFDRINRNVMKLKPQELRHAKYSGVFAQAAERMTTYLSEQLPIGVPNISPRTKLQMKDVEFVAQLLLLCEMGPDKDSQEYLDMAYSERDSNWATAGVVEKCFRRVVQDLKELFNVDLMAANHTRRLRNQSDFYSLFGAYKQIRDNKEKVPAPNDAARRLNEFMLVVADEQKRQVDQKARKYYESVRSSATDLSRRSARIDIIREVILDEGKPNAS
jgi:hypothetical protein